jgi:uncharacterized protein (TIGR02996 family)
VRLRLPAMGRGLRAVRAGALTTPDGARGRIAFADWLAEQSRPAPEPALEEAAGWA